MKMVDELINPLIGTWDEDMLRFLFLPIDVSENSPDTVDPRQRRFGGLAFQQV